MQINPERLQQARRNPEADINFIDQAISFIYPVYHQSLSTNTVRPAVI